MDGRSQRITGTLTPRAKRTIAAASALIVVGFGGAAIWGATHADSYGGSRGGCVTVSMPSTTGGALVHACGAGARALCANAYSGHDRIALLTQRQCGLAGLAPAPSAATSAAPHGG